MQTRRLKNARSGKSANDKRSYSKEEKGERLRIVKIGRETPLTIDLETENSTGIHDAVPRLGRRQCETGLDRLLLEDTDRAGPVPVSTIEMTIAAGHSRLYFVFGVSCRAPRTQSLNTAYFLSILSIHLADRNYWLPVYWQKRTEEDYGIQRLVRAKCRVLHRK